jgi:hypothetical protein
MGDINDVYTWMTGDGLKLNLVMTVSPVDVTTRTFGPAVQYVFHVNSHPGTSGATVIAQPISGETKVICTFTSNTAVQCWVVAGTTVKDYVTGDPSATAGLSSTDGKLKVFAGQRSDPFFFNLQGFRAAIAGVHAAAPGLTFNANGCPNNLTDVQVGGLVATLSGQAAASAAGVVPACSGTVKDCFATYNVKAIVVQVDKTLVLNGTDTFLSVWGSTHATP